MYSAYAGAMRKNFSKSRPAMPTYLFDGTGQQLGKTLCHGEMGSADFIGDTKHGVGIRFNLFKLARAPTMPCP